MRRISRLNRGPWLAVLVGLGMLAGLARPAGAQELQIDAPSFSVDRATETYRYTDARIRFGGLQLDAQEILISRPERTLTASGLVRFRDGTVVGTAHRVVLDLNTGTGTLYLVSLYQAEDGYYLSGAEIRRESEGIYVAKDCRFSTCEPRNGGWALGAGHIEYRPGSYGIATDATLRVGDVPIFWFPFVAWPTVTERTTGVLPPELTVQDSSLPRLNIGTRLAVPVFIALGPDHDLTLTPEIIDRRGPALGTEYAYAFVPGQRGLLRLWNIREAHPRNPRDENDILAAGEAEEQPRELSRYLYQWSHNQPLGERGRVVLRAEGSSDGQVYREYERIEEYSPYRVEQGSLSYQWDWLQTAISADRQAEFTSESIYADDESFTDQAVRPVLLPRLRATLGSRLFSAVPLTLEADSSMTRFTTEEGLSGMVTTITPAVGLPLNPLPGLEFRPILRRHFVSYSALVEREPDVPEVSLDEEGRMQDEYELELRYNLSRVFAQDSGPWSDIKHILRPRLLRQVRADVAQPRAGLVLQPLVAQDLVILRLDNTWLGRTSRTQGRASELGWLNVIQRYDRLREAEAPSLAGPALPDPPETGEGQPLLPAILEGGLSTHGLNLGMLFRYHHQRSRVTETRFHIAGQVSPRSTLAISYIQNDLTYRTPDNKLFPEQTTLGFTGEVRVTDPVSLGLSSTLNLRPEPPPLDRRVELGEAYIDYHLDCYAVRLSYQEALDSTVEGDSLEYFVDRRILLTFNLGGLFSVGTRRSFATGISAIETGAGQ